MQSPINDETLVAYLDGELPREERAQVDQHLQANADLRQRITALRGSWELLGELPQVEPRQGLAQSTIEIVTLAVEKESRDWRAWFWSNRWIALGLGGLFMLAAGAATSRAVTEYETRRLLVNLPTIVDYPSLKHIDSVEFLQSLANVVNLTAAAGSNEERAMVGDGQVPTIISERKSWVENLTEESRGRLQKNWVDYKVEDDDRKATLNEITQAIVNNPAGSAQYLETIRAYRILLESWSVKAQLEVNGKDGKSVEERIEKIQARVARDLALNHVPSAADRQVFRDWLGEIVDREEGMEQFFILDEQQIIEDLSGDPEDSIVTKEDVDDLIHRLSPSASKLLTNIADEWSKRYTLGLWINSRATAERPTGLKDLQESFNARPEQVQNELEFLPEAEARRRLRPTNDDNANSNSNR